jgi:hypothetical protein
MAFTAKPTISVSYVCRDNDGKNSTAEVTIDGATLPANAVAFATALRPIIAALLDSVIVGQNVLIGAYEDAIAITGRCDVEDKGLFLFNSANGQPASIALPSISETVLQANNEDIDVANAAVAAFVNAMTLGLGTPLVQPVNAGGADLVGVKSAYKQNRRSHLSAGRGRKG